MHLEAERRKGLKMMKLKVIKNRALMCVSESTMQQRIAHICSDFIIKTAQKEAAHGLDKMTTEDFNCEICMLAKAKRRSYWTVETTFKYKVDECLHADLGFAKTSLRGKMYFLLTKDFLSTHLLSKDYRWDWEKCDQCDQFDILSDWNQCKNV